MKIITAGASILDDIMEHFETSDKLSKSKFKEFENKAFDKVGLKDWEGRMV